MRNEFKKREGRPAGWAATRPGGRAAHQGGTFLGQGRSRSAACEQRSDSSGGGVVWLCGSLVRCSPNSSPAPAQPPRGRLLKYGDKLPAQYLAENCQLSVLLPLSVPVTVWIDSVDSWCSGVHLAGGRRWRWHCSCAVRFSCTPLI